MSVLRDLLDDLSEEWQQRTIYGKFRLPFEVVVVSIVLLFLGLIYLFHLYVQAFNGETTDSERLLAVYKDTEDTES